MKANELRLGNYIFCNHKVDIVWGIDEWNGLAKLYTENGGHGERNIDPIPLTEEWLVKFGFEKSPHPMPSYEFDGVEIFKPHPDNNYWLLGADHRCRRFHYVHQLQNLYFALTGEELTVR